MACIVQCTIYMLPLFRYTLILKIIMAYLGENVGPSLPLTYPFHFNPTSQLHLYILLSPTQLPPPPPPSNQPTISIFHVLLESFAAAGQHLTLMKGEPRKE